jgi:ketosteroid isomerase-like protein
MAATTPDDIHRLFAERFRARDLDGLIELYDPEAVFLLPDGGSVTGAAAIREVLDGFLRLAETFELAHGGAAQADGVALLQDDWTLRGRDAAGNPVELTDRTAGVARRRADGDWRIVIDNPWGLSADRAA